MFCIFHEYAELGRSDQFRGAKICSQGQAQLASGVAYDGPGTAANADEIAFLAHYQNMQSMYRAEYGDFFDEGGALVTGIKGIGDPASLNRIDIANLPAMGFIDLGFHMSG